jgi:hypothetical protein
VSRCGDDGQGCEGPLPELMMISSFPVPIQSIPAKSSRHIQLPQNRKKEKKKKANRRVRWLLFPQGKRTF